MSQAFRPQGVSAPRAFTSSRPQKDYPRDRLAVVNGYDLNRGVMLATEQGTDQKLEVTIQQRNNTGGSTPRAPRTGGAEKKWSGDKIDTLMAESLVQGTWVILEGCRGSERVMQGKESVLPVSTRWVVNVSEPRNDKCFSGVFTATAYKGAIDSVQAWDEKGIDVNADNTTNNSQALNDFAARLDAVHEAFQNRERPVRLGFQFRILKEVEPATEGQGNRPGRPAVYEVVDMSYPIDWIKSDSSDPNEIGAPPTGNQFFSYIDGYTDHIWGSAEGAEEKIEPKFPPEELEKMRFEITTYRHFKAGTVQFNERLSIPEPEAGRVPSVLYTLTHTPTRYSEGDEHTIGKNFAVRGILQLVNDTFDKKATPPQIVPNNMVRQLFANGPRANVQAMIATSDGGRVRVAPGLDRVLERTERAAPSEAGTAGASELKAGSGDPLSGIESPFGADMGGFLGDDGADAFLDAASTPAPAAPAAAPAEDAPQAPESGGRFQRRSRV